MPDPKREEYAAAPEGARLTIATRDGRAHEYVRGEGGEWFSEDGWAESFVMAAALDALWHARQRIAALEAEASARERKAAAKALREAATDEELRVAHGLVVDALTIRQMLRSRADAIEAGTTTEGG